MAIPPRSRPGAPGPAAGPRPATQSPQSPASGVSKVNWGSQDMTQKMVARGEQSYRNKDGANYKGIIDDTKAKNLTIGKITMADHYWSIVPYLAGTMDPEVISGRMQPGDPTYTVGVYVHRNVGSNKDKIICLAKTYGQSCAVCDYREELSRQPDGPDEAENKRRDEEVKSLLPSKFMSYLYYIWDRDNESKGVQIYEISGYFFERELQAQAKSARSGGYIPFMSPLAGQNGGRDIAFKVSGDKSKQDWTGIKFELREHPLPAHILDQAAIPLDELLNVPTPEEVYELFWGGVQQAGQPELQNDNLGPAGEQPYECHQTGVCGGYQDCQGCQFYPTCTQGGMTQGWMPGPNGPEVNDIPSDPVPQPQPEPAPAPPPAATPRTTALGKPPLLRRGQR